MMRSLIRISLVSLLWLAAAQAVLVNSNTSVGIPTLPGYTYKATGLGTWGGASVTLQTLQDSIWLTIPGATYTADFELTRINAAGRELRAVISNSSGSTAISITLTEVAASGGGKLTTGSGVADALAIPIGTNGAVQRQGDPLTPTSIVLPDVTSVVPAANSVGLKNGRITIGNGVATGGVSVQARTMKGFLRFDTGTQPITGAFTRVASIPIYPADIPYVNGSTFLNYTMYGNVTLTNNSYSSSIKDWGFGFAFNDDSLLAKSNATWIYGSLHPAPGTAKNLTWMTAHLRSKSRFYPSSGLWTFYDPNPLYTPYGVDASVSTNVVNYPVGSMPNNSGQQILSPVTGGQLWLMVHAEKITGQAVGGVIDVSYDLTLEFP